MSWIERAVDEGRLNWPRILLLTLTIVVVLVLGVVAATSTSAFNLYNPSWDGATDLRGQIEDSPGVESELVRETARYDNLEANETVVFVIAPDEPYEDEEADQVRRFVERGGTLVVLENFGSSGDTLLADIGADAQFDGRILRDERHHYRGPTMPIATEVENHTLTDNVDQLTLNYATAIDSGEATVLVSTSDFAYLTEENDAELGAADDLDTYPVATVEDVGEGQVIAIGDPSIVINAMLTQPDNSVFIQNVYGGNQYVVLDLSHAGDVPPLTEAVLTIREIPVLQVLVGGVGIGILALLSVRAGHPVLPTVRAWLPWIRPRTDRQDETASPAGLSDSEQAAFLRERHPDWDEERVQRVITAFNNTGTKRRDDE